MKRGQSGERASATEERLLRVLEKLESRFQVYDDQERQYEQNFQQLDRRLNQVEYVQRQQMTPTARVQVRQGYMYGPHGKVTEYMKETSYTAYGRGGVVSAEAMFRQSIRQWPPSLTGEDDDVPQNALEYPKYRHC